MNEIIVEQIIKNSIGNLENIDLGNMPVNESDSVNEETGKADVAVVDQIIGQLVKEVFPLTLANEICSVQPLNGPSGHIISIGRDPDEEVTPEVSAVAQVVTIDSIVAANSTTYSLTINGEEASYTSDIDATVAEITLGLTNAINALVGAGAATTATDNGTNVTIQADVAGTPFLVVVTAGTMTATTTTPNTAFVAAVIENGGVSVSRTLVNAETHLEQGAYTKEAIEDIVSQFGELGVQMIAKAMSATIVDKMNSELIANIKTAAEPKTTFTFVGTEGLWSETRKLMLKIAAHISDMNRETRRGFHPYIIATPKLATMIAMSGLELSDTENATSAYIGKISGIKLYMDIDDTSGDDAQSVIIGHKSEKPGDAGYIFSPYHTSVFNSVSAVTGESKLFVNNRYVLTLNPADKGTGTADSNFFKKFTVDISAFTDLAS